MLMDNSSINLKSFSKQLTHWIKRQDAVKYTHTFFKYDGTRCYGKAFVIKKDNATGKYAIFIRKENRLKRWQDQDMRMNLTLDKFLLLRINKKQEGISLLHTFLNSF